MKVLFAMHPLIGHFHAMAPLALALREDGHSVRFATGARFGTILTRLGFDHASCGLDMEGFQHFLPSLPEWPAIVAQTEPGGIRQLWGFLLGCTPPMIDDLLPLVRKWQPDVIVRDPSEFGSIIVAEVCDIPYASIVWAIYMSTWGCEQPLAELRARYDLPAGPDPRWFDRYLALNALPASWPIMGDVPPLVHRVRMPPFDQSLAHALPDWVHTLPDQPTVYATLGTAFSQRPDLFRTLIDALSDEPFNTIITVGSAMDPAQFDPLPPQVRVAQYIPQTLILAHCDAMVFHGGYNSLLSALWYGVPVVVTPLDAGDQLPTAQQCVDQGNGVIVEGQPPAPDALRDAVRTVLMEPQYRDRARQFQQEFNTLPPLFDAVQRLETLARTRAPQPTA